MSSLTLAHNTTNDTRLADAMAVVRDLARDEAAGDDALANLAVHFIRQVQEGVFDPAKDQNGEDAAARIFKVYATTKGKKAYHDRTELSVKVQSSKFRQLQKAASNPKYADYTDTNNRGITIRQQAIDDGIDVKSPFPAMVDLAREQLKQDDDLDDAQIFAIVTKTESVKEVTLESKLKQIHKITEDIITGEKWPGVFDQSPELMQIEELVRNRLGDIVKLREQSERVAEIIALGGVQNADGSWTV